MGCGCGINDFVYMTIILFVVVFLHILMCCFVQKKKRIDIVDAYYCSKTIHRIHMIGELIMSKTFLDLLIEKKVRADKIDDYIDGWHKSGKSETRELHEYLGMTIDEYCLWIENGNDILDNIIKERINKG